MISELITTCDRRWSEMLGRVHYDFYHLPEYVHLCAKFEGGTPCAYYSKHHNIEMLIPLLLRSLPLTLKKNRGIQDIASPYGYSSILLSNVNKEEIVHDLFSGLNKYAKANNIITAFIRMHPLLPVPKVQLCEGASYFNHGKTVYFNLGRQDENETWMQMRENHRRDIKRLRQLGYKILIDSWDLLDNVISLYHENMIRLGARDHYFFPAEYFYLLRNNLTAYLHLFTVMSPSHEIAAAGFFSTCKIFAQYHLGATNSNFLHHAPSKLMFDFARCWAKERNCRFFHLGGGLGGSERDSLFHFKAGFSPKRATFTTLRIVFSENIMEDLIKATSLEKPHMVGQMTNFFPPYRETMPKIF